MGTTPSFATMVPAVFTCSGRTCSGTTRCIVTMRKQYIFVTCCGCWYVCCGPYYLCYGPMAGACLALCSGPLSIPFPIAARSYWVLCCYRCELQRVLVLALNDHLWSARHAQMTCYPLAPVNVWCGTFSWYPFITNHPLGAPDNSFRKPCTCTGAYITSTCFVFNKDKHNK